MGHAGFISSTVSSSTPIYSTTPIYELEALTPETVTIGRGPDESADLSERSLDSSRGSSSEGTCKSSYQGIDAKLPGKTGIQHLVLI